MTSVEERLGDVVVTTYKRGSAATHEASERDEVLQLLQYINNIRGHSYRLKEKLKAGLVRIDEAAATT